MNHAVLAIGYGVDSKSGKHYWQLGMKGLGFRVGGLGFKGTRFKRMILMIVFERVAKGHPIVLAV